MSDGLKDQLRSWGVHELAAALSDIERFMASFGGELWRIRNSERQERIIRQIMTGNIVSDPKAVESVLRLQGQSEMIQIDADDEMGLGRVIRQEIARREDQEKRSGAQAEKSSRVLQ